ncbi:hypothetical protein SS1G_06591 [Sclerotinia sclerotiorum 1980 UF-70]|uniref:DNA polymerase epsilon subunit D n=2 Tax=Sclerotinia sclerotiorum (strain ATCC 18683 / 1980 / Ss-1) TaxID=665079 RepID=A7EMP2_SCLS1|nr:hypothetical protein SS1G_06591 [Sclerotinia sclerotiorum 1980 UF-70]APA14616.1 hypothetical protein sscle_13g093860 [Sclerotinia sclerotiorum 1980 UF-70]EDO04108.1 hypothetical protein SS1G_06591 [Sclerotinia sclerotiorum 1980 UF-70]
MPPRKSDVVKPVTGDEATPAKETTVVREGTSIEDLNLPKSIVTRLAKGVLPPNTQIQGNAMLAMSKSATVFVNYLATHANENAHNRSVKTIAPQDVFKALDDLEFPDFKPRLEAELAKFLETQSDKRNTYRKKVAADKVAGSQAGGENGEGDSEMLDREGDGEPKAKKARRDEGSGGSGETQEEHDEEMDAEEDNEEHDEEEEGEEAEDEGEGEGEVRDDDDGEERFEVEEPEEREAEDEALDNGEDSD